MEELKLNDHDKQVLAGMCLVQAISDPEDADARRLMCMLMRYELLDAICEVYEDNTDPNVTATELAKATGIGNMTPDVIWVTIRHMYDVDLPW